MWNLQFFHTGGSRMSNSTAIFARLNPADYHTIRQSRIPISAANGLPNPGSTLGTYIVTYTTEVGKILKLLGWIKVMIVSNSDDCIVLVCDEPPIEPPVVNPTKKRRIKNCP